MWNKSSTTSRRDKETEEFNMFENLSSLIKKIVLKRIDKNIDQFQNTLVFFFLSFKHFVESFYFQQRS